MSYRERVLLLAVVAACGYAAYVFLVERPNAARARAEGTAGAGQRELEQAVNTLRAQVGACRVPEVQTALLARAASPWTEDRMFRGRLPSEVAAEKAQGDAEAKARAAAAGAASEPERQRLAERQAWEKEISGTFAYTGFATMGRERLAILNGIEYRVGEEPPPGGCLIERIEPDKVVLRRKGGEGTVTLRLQQ